jgi:hypothetical protein
MRTRIALIAGAALLASTPALVAAPGAQASSACVGASCGGGTINCGSGSSCLITLENEVHITGNWQKDGSGNNITIDPPPCEWAPLGDSHDGAVSVVALLAQTQDNYNQPITGELLTIYNQAYKMQEEASPPPGEWYFPALTPGSDSNADVAECDKMAPFVWVAQAKPGQAPAPPPVPIPAMTLAELAMAVLQSPQAGAITTSPAGHTTYSNMPTFVKVGLKPPEHGGLHYSGAGQPYSEVVVTLGGVGVTAWAKATTVRISIDGSGHAANSCGYLGSQEFISDPGQVAGVGVGGHVDCGVTFLEPQQAQVTATINWDVCYVLKQEAFPTPPPACRTYTTLKPTTWAWAFNVEEIQAGNG